MTTLRAASMMVLLLAPAACEQGSSAPEIEPVVDPNAPAFTIVPSTTEISAARGWNAIVNFSITRRPGYAEAVTLSTVDLPAGVTGAFAAPTLAPTSHATRLDLEVDTLMVPGTYVFSVRATGANATASVISLSLTVPRPSFTLVGLGIPAGAVSSNPGAGLPLMVDGLQTSIGFRIGRENGFRGPVTLTLTDIPAGVIGASTYTFLATEGSMTFRAGPTAIPGTYKVGIKATGADVEERMYVLTLLVRPPA